MISKYKNVEVEAKTYQNGRGGKGSVAGSQEILFVCKPKPKHFVYFAPLGFGHGCNRNLLKIKNINHLHLTNPSESRYKSDFKGRNNPE
ncbi:MAG: hypothetical protein KIS77_13750 [Saprospiraceae bacterium]|nr:hypothetical protein [Saprospiraceae bacterium]